MASSPTPQWPHSGVNWGPDQGDRLLQHTILAVDDDRPIRVLLQQLLEAEGHRVVVAEDGAAALEACRDNTFSLVIADVVMPGVSGIELRRQLANDHPELPVILISGHDIENARTFSSTASLTTFLAKPFEPAQLLALVRDTPRLLLAS